MRLLLYVGIGWLAYMYLLYPLALAVIGAIRRVHPIKGGEEFLPKVSVLIAARNEERDIGWKINETLAWDYPPDHLEILVASDASEDLTDEIVQNTLDPRVKLVRMQQHGGKARGLNCIAAQAQGELLLFTDANAHIPSQCLKRLVRHFADDHVGCVTGRSEPASVEHKAGLVEGSSIYWNHEGIIRELENRLGSVLVCDGAIFATRRKLFTTLSSDLANDLELPLKIGAAGHWIVYESEAVVFEKETSSPVEEFSRRRRICAQGLLGMWKLRSTLRGLRGWQFFSHKFLRWLTFVPLFLILVSTVYLARTPAFRLLAGLEVLSCMAALVGFYRAVAGKYVPRVFSMPLYVLVTAVGALVGMFDACAGRRFDVWKSPTLTRGGTNTVLPAP